MHRIFIVEDDRVIAQQVSAALCAWGLEARCAADFQNVMAEFTAFDPQLVLMDISLPFFNGYHWCGEIRKVSRVPVVFLSSAADNMNIVMAMNMGGDDFVPKPFDMNVLLAKVQAILRRAYDYRVTDAALTVRGAQLLCEEASLQTEKGKLKLSKNEFRILLTLAENKGKVISRELLMEKLWETDSFVDENTLTVNVARLRKKLEGAGLCDLIETRKGMGYILTE